MTSDVRRNTRIDRVGIFLSAALVVVFFGLPLFRGLGATDLKGDEPIYSFAVDRMLDRGDWLTPKSIPDERTAFLEKPPLKMWIVAAGVHFGLLPGDEFGHRFWDAVFGLVAFLYVLAIGQRLGGPVAGLVAVFVLFVHYPLVYEHGLRSNNMEAALVLSYCGGVYHALAWASASARWRRRLHPVAVGAWFVLGFMTKFVAALFLPVILVVMVLLFPTWRRRALEDWGAWALSALLAAALIAPWFVYEARRFPNFWQIILGEHIYRRFTAYLDPNHLQPWHYYFTTLRDELRASRTLILVTTGSVLLLFRTIVRRWDVGAILLLWFVVPMTAMSFGTSKLYHYTYPFLPPLALAAGMIFVVVLERDSAIRAHLQRLATWLGQTAAGQRLQRSSPLVRTGVYAVAAIALVMATWTALQSMRIWWGGALLFRNASVVRPAVIAALLFSLAGRARVATWVLIVPLLLAAVSFNRYDRITSQLERRDAPLGQLRDCLLRAQASGAPRGVVVQTEDVGLWAHYYYLGPAGFDSTQPRTHETLVRLLFAPGEERPVFLATTDYTRLRERLTADAAGQASVERLELLRRVEFPDDRMVLLPARYGSCGAPASTSVERTVP